MPRRKPSSTTHLAIADDRHPSRASRVRQAAGRRAASIGTSAKELPADLVDAIEDRLDQLVQRIVDHPSPVTTPKELSDALDAARSHKGASSIATFLAGTGIARRTVGLGTRRIPALVAITGTATALTTFAGGFRELRMIASYVVNRAHAVGIEVHPGRLRIVTLQLYLTPGVTPSVDAPPRLLATKLGSRWVRSAAAAALPLVPDGIGRPSVRKWVEAADLVDVRLLEAPEEAIERQ
ncbi:MAG: hypothetical protein JJE52_08245 [Acidimicrobiia bacterium]|nr:hypothetical protein [Acidimicrobiia bacterium]